MTEEVRPCAVRTCPNERQRDSLFCPAHLDLMWRNRLERQSDGSYLPVPEWVFRARERRLSPKELSR